jgi:hypothetical protein
MPGLWPGCASRSCHAGQLDPWQGCVCINEGISGAFQHRLPVSARIEIVCSLSKRCRNAGVGRLSQVNVRVASRYGVWQLSVWRGVDRKDPLLESHRFIEKMDAVLALTKAPSGGAAMSLADPPVWAGAGERWSSAMLDRRLLVVAVWPNLTRFPPADVPTLARVCALLSRRPMVGGLVSRVLALPDEQVRPRILMLYANGYLRAAVPSGRLGDLGSGVTAPEAAQGGFAGPTAEASFVGRLWLRLTSRDRLA